MPLYRVKTVERSYLWRHPDIRGPKVQQTFMLESLRQKDREGLLLHSFCVVSLNGALFALSGVVARETKAFFNAGKHK